VKNTSEQQMNTRENRKRSKKKPERIPVVLSKKKKTDINIDRKIKNKINKNNQSSEKE